MIRLLKNKELLIQVKLKIKMPLCQFCKNVSFVQRCRLEEHEKDCPYRPKLKCSKCDKSFVQQSRLDEHELECPETSQSKSVSKVQKKESKLSEKEEFACKYVYYSEENKCPMCFLVFNEKDDLSKHIALEHDKFRDLVDEFMSFRIEGGEPEESCKLAIQNLVAKLKPDQLLSVINFLHNQGKDLFRKLRNTQYFPVLMGHCVFKWILRTTFQTNTKCNNINHV